MAKMKKVKKPQKIKDTTKQKKPRQGHKLVWLTLIIIAIPCAMVAYVLFTSMETQNTPVTGNRFSKADLNPAITKTNRSDIESQLQTIEGVESVSVNLKSATLRILVDISDDASVETAQSVIDQSVGIVYSICPMETYFTNTEDAKMYDLEVNVYNFMVDDAHTTEGQVYLMYTKTGAGDAVIDNMNDAKNWDIVNQIRRE